jgi:hypothetical protein
MALVFQLGVGVLFLYTLGQGETFGWLYPSRFCMEHLGRVLRDPEPIVVSPGILTLAFGRNTYLAGARIALLRWQRK